MGVPPVIGDGEGPSDLLFTILGPQKVARDDLSGSRDVLNGASCDYVARKSFVSSELWLSSTTR
jgi:hypothetical protein